MTTTAPARGRMAGRPRTPGPSLAEERRRWRIGDEWVAGLDEVGRGAWAGPVSVGIAIVRPRARTRSLPLWLRDSKQLAEQRREDIFAQVAAWTAAWAIGHASAWECDRWGMTGALRLASRRALVSLPRLPDVVLMDGPFDYLSDPLDGAGPELPMAAPSRQPTGVPPVVPLVDGDARCAAVAAASVLAKVVRDRVMRGASAHYPLYGFDQNKGYPSPLHRSALQHHGLSAIHRRSWKFADPQDRLPLEFDS
jgi:ribonuclease HII